jgi:hypothetical protein
LKEMVARDGIEPPTPAFSGPLTDSPKWFEIRDVTEGEKLVTYVMLSCRNRTKPTATKSRPPQSGDDRRAAAHDVPE